MSAGDLILQDLLGCCWGRAVWTQDDGAVCHERATSIVVVHDGPRDRDLKLCPKHRDRVLSETTPHEHRTSFETVAPAYLSRPRYVPTCSCGFRGAPVNTAAAALAMANAHAREQGAEPLPPEDCHS